MNITPLVRACAGLSLALFVAACGGEDPRTQITLMIDADPSLKAQIDSLRVELAGAPIGTPVEDFDAQPNQDFSSPEWPIVIVLLPEGGDANRAFRVGITARDTSDDLVIEASARSHFLKGKTLGLRIHLRAQCRSAVFAGCEDNQTCRVSGSGNASCADDEIDPATLPIFRTVEPSSDAGVDGNIDTDADMDANVPTRTVTGRIFTTEGLTALSGASVSLEDGTPVATNSDGEFTLPRGQSADTLIIEHPDHAPQTKLLPDVDSVYLEVFVKSVDARSTFEATSGGNVSKGDGSAAVFPADALVRPNGDRESGEAQLTLATPDPKDPAQAQSFPGDFHAVDRDGSKDGALSASAVMDVTATADGRKLNLDEGTQAEVSFAVKDPGAPATADLWSFDPTLREWSKEGTATLTRDRDGNKVYRASIGHLSWWAVGSLVEDTTCVRLCAEYNAAPAPYARVTLTGIDTAFTSSAFADETGCVAIDLPMSSQLSLLVQSIDGVASPSLVQTNDTAASSSQPSTCDDLGTIVLGTRDDANVCPAEWMTCRGVTGCVNISSDAQHCGTCETACGAGQRCINGSCGCAANETACDGVCFNTQTDARHCGACDQACASDHVCQAGACVLVQCNAPLVSCDGVCVNLQLDGVNGECPRTVGCAGDGDCADDSVCEPTTSSCRRAVCGDGNTEANEECDDDNTTSYDGCSALCRFEDLCDGQDDDNDGFEGEDANLQGDAANCGACGNVCTSGVCVAGQCSVTCVPRICPAVPATCGTPSDGCGGILNCGTCTGAETCGGGGVPNQCGSAPLCGDAIVSAGETCDDGNQASGDGCAATCQVEQGWTCPTPGFLCTMLTEVCNNLDDDSDTRVDEGYDLDTDVNNCGGCANVCSVSNAYEACTAGICAIQSCVAGRGNCDSTYNNGCETVTTNNVNHCGGCGIICGSANTTSSNCMAGSCNIACQAGWANCDGNNANGCETNITTPANCGSCGFACNVAHGTPACTAGTCVIAACELPNYDDCDGMYVNGCEADLNNDQNNCSICNYTCFPSTCSSGFCN